uniref:Transcription initiation factor TFIID 150 kDa subunit n=1 Tax=Ascaris lumbricoides TaxID=6252 RepID=A0A0M3ICW1_ASCLU
MIELEIRQDPTVNSGRQSYVGPVTVAVQELDGSFTHTIQIDSDQSKHDLQCHSKGRRQKKKKIPLSTGEELEIDLTNMDPDSPVLWIRIDPDLLLVRKVNIRQPVYQWEYMLKYERDVLAQLHALDVLQRFPSPHVRTILIEAVENENYFYRVRCRAAFSLTEVVNKLPETWLGPPALLVLFKKLFGCKSAPHIPKPNNFVVTSSNLQLYFVMNTLPQALARLRTSSNAALSEVHRFIIGLIKYNDNSMNRYSDDHYRASLISALAATVVPADNLDGNLTPDTLNSDMKETLAEFTHALDMDTLKPSFRRVVGISALQAIYQLQCNAHLPVDPKIFWLFAQPKIFSLLRRAALVYLVDMVHRSRLPIMVEVLNRLIEMSVMDREPAIRYHIPRQLCERPPFLSTSSEIGPSNPTNTKELAHQLWAIIVDAKTESRLRGHFIDLWFVLYGNGIPAVLRSADSAPQTTTTMDHGGNRMVVTHGVERPVDVLGENMWHSITPDLEEPDSPINRVTSELNDDMLQ